VHARLIDRLAAENAGVIVFDIDFSRSKPGDEDAVLAHAIAGANRVVLFEWLSGGRERVITSTGGDAGWTWVERLQPPTAILAAAAKALGPFPLPKLDQAAFEFWTFKPSTGDAPTTAAVALQLTGLNVYDEWLAVLKAAQARGVAQLPAHAAEIKTPDDMLQLTRILRRMFKQEPSLEARVGKAIEGWKIDSSVPATRQLLTALVRLYAGPDHYYINFYGPPGTIYTIPYESLLTGTNSGDHGHGLCESAERANA
jgi:adenylate cyclase